MSELYKAIAGSPITYLAADISANQTTISIADDSALPDGPNICTIGYGENLETIKYENKSNGVLQNVTRGIEGTPRAWSAGTEVARFFTAYDYNALIENFNSHLAESASKHITESGTNSNGSYIKFDDGTMICYSNRDCSAPPDSPHGALYSTGSDQWTFPSRFISTPSIFINEVKGAGSCWGSLAGSAATTIGTSFRLYRASSSSLIPTAGLYAIGRWKQ